MEPMSGPVVQLGKLALEFGQVDRVTYHDDGKTPESDTDHTVMLGLVACAFAQRHIPWLDIGKVAQLALVHDVVEVYCGDVSTLRITDEQRSAKAEAEEIARGIIEAEFKALPWLAATIATYESKQSDEARYVKAMDKLLPKITHILNGCVTIREHRMDRAELVARYDAQADELYSYASIFTPLWQLRYELIQLVLERLGES